MSYQSGSEGIESEHSPLLRVTRLSDLGIVPGVYRVDIRLSNNYRQDGETGYFAIAVGQERILATTKAEMDNYIEVIVSIEGGTFIDFIHEGLAMLAVDIVQIR